MRKLMIGCLLLALAGCGQPSSAPSATPGSAGAPSATPASQPATPTGAPSAPTAEPATPAGNQADFLLSIKQEGGIAGILMGTVVNSAGLVRFTESKLGGPEELQLRPEQLTQLRALIDSEEFKQLEQSYLSQTCADCFVYTIAVTRGDAVQVVMTDDASDKPPALDQLLRLMAQIRAGS